MKKTALYLFSALLLFTLPSPVGAKEKLVIAGTGDSQLLLRSLAKAFEEKNKGIRVEIPESIGSSGGIRAAADGAADLGRVAREIKEQEKKYNLNYMIFAQSPVVFVVNPSVKGIENITTGDIIGIMTGEISSWTQLGGDEYKIYVVQREFGDSSRIALGNAIPQLRDKKEMEGKVFYSTPETVAALKKYKHTFGFTSFSATKNSGLLILKVNGVYPSAESIKSGKYPYVVPFGFVWKGELKGLPKKFVQFVKSSEGRKIISNFGAVPTDK